MTQSLSQLSATNSTGLCLGTGCLSTRGMTQSLSQLSATNGTGLSGSTGSCCAGGVTQCINFFLCNQSLAADRAVLAFGQTGFGTGRSNSLVNCVGVTQCFNQLSATNGTGLSGSTGSCCTGSMAQSLDGSIGVAVLTTVLTGMGGVTILSTSGIGYNSIIFVSQLCDFFGLGNLTTVTGDGLHASCLAGSSSGYLLLEGACCISMLTSPDTVNGLVSYFAQIVGGFHIGAVSILQLAGSNGNFIILNGLIIIAQALYLIGLLIRLAGLHDDGAGAANACAAFSGINITDRQVSCAVNFNVSVIRSARNILCGVRIAQVDVGSIASTGKRLALVVYIATIIDPLIIVVDKDLVAAAKGTGCTLTNNQSCTGKQRNILGHFHLAGVHGNGHITINGQCVLAGIDSLAAKQTQLHGDAQALNGKIAIHIDCQTTSGFIIILDDMAAGNIKHTTGSDEGNRSSLNANQRNRNGHIAIFDSAGLQCQGYFNILDIVLGHGENAVRIIDHTGGIVAAAPVHNLEALVNSTAIFHGHGAAALNVTPGIQLTTVVNGNGAAGVHLDEAAVTSGRALTTTG